MYESAAGLGEGRRGSMLMRNEDEVEVRRGSVEVLRMVVRVDGVEDRRGSIGRCSS